MRLRVAGAQVPVTDNVRANVATIRRAIDFAAERRADILLTPEGSLSGYRPDFEADEVAGAWRQIVGVARSHRLALALGTCFREADGKVYNQVRFTGPDGSFLGFHAKILRCGTLEEPARGEIEHYAEAALQTFTLIGVTVGALICNDLWANPGCTPMPDPHLTQQLSRRGARVVLHAVNGGRNGSEWSEVNWRFHESNLRMRARASDLWIVTVDNCWPESSDCSAPSGVVGPDGSWRYRSPERGEDVFVYDIELGDEGSG